MNESKCDAISDGRLFQKVEKERLKAQRIFDSGRLRRQWVTELASQ